MYESSSIGVFVGSEYIAQSLWLKRWKTKLAKFEVVVTWPVQVTGIPTLKNIHAVQKGCFRTIFWCATDRDSTKRRIEFSFSPGQSHLDMSLITNSVEVLEQVTGMLFTSEQVRLWQCGDRTLNLKLRNGGLKRTSLNWSSSSWMPWPRSFFETMAGLEELEWRCSFGESLCPSLELKLLPRTLKRLHIDCADVFILLRKHSVNMNKLFPQLHMLHLSGSRLSEENLKNLPSHLVELCVASPSFVWDMREATFRDLPRSIEKLKLDFRIGGYRLIPSSDFPSNLVTLDIRLNGQSIQELPKSLKMLTMDHFPDWLTLPPELEELSVSALPVCFLPRLPQSLKVLETDIFEPKIVDEDVPNLPKNLTRLKTTYSQITDSGLQQLPASMVDYEFRVYPNRPDVLSQFRPETVRLDLGPCSKTLNPSPFPTKLQYLSIHTINDELCALLLPGLQELCVIAGRITAEGASKFPKSLQKLQIDVPVFDRIETFSHIAFIPKLELLARRFDSRCNLGGNWLSYLLPFSDCPANPSRNCSAELTNVSSQHGQLASLTVDFENWEYPNGFPLKEFFFVSLPKFIHLNTLDINPCLSGTWFAFIPDNVTSFSVQGLQDFPTAKDLDSLPKRLQSLSISIIRSDSECSWNNEVLQALPRSLKKFRINGYFPNLTDRMTEFAPPNLQKMSKEYGQDFPLFAGPLDRLYGQI